MKTFKSTISAVLSFCLLFVLLTGNVSAEANSSNLSSNPDGIQVIENNETTVTVFGEKDGIEAYVTYDKISHETTARTIEKPKNVLSFSLVKPIESEYSIDIKTAVDGQLSAIATNTDTNEILVIKDSNLDSGTVQAQGVLVLIPVGTWLGALVVAALATAAVLYIGEVVYVSLSEAKVEKETKKDEAGYYYAHVDQESNSIFIGPKITYNAAKAWLQASTTNNIFTPTRTRAETLAKNTGTGEPIEHINEWLTKGEGYLKHFHPRNPMFVGSKAPNHVWYF